MEVQHLVEYIRAERWEASLGLGVGWRCGRCWAVVVLSCKLMMMVGMALISLQLDSHDLPQVPLEVH